MSYPHDCNDCEKPVIQCNPLTTDDVNYVGNPDDCIPLTFNEKLTSALNKIVTYLKNRLFGIVSNSLVVTAVDNNCNKYQRIELVPSTDEGNILTLGTDGYPYVPEGDGGDSTPIIVNNIERTVVIDSTGILGHTLSASVLLADGPGFEDNEIQELPGGAGLYVAPFQVPKNFAVSGNTRSSNLGAIEFFDTLTLANASAIAGETVILYEDTAENLVVKAGVHYKGFGQKSINSLICSVVTNTVIDNLTIQGASTVSNGEIKCSNVLLNNSLLVNGVGKIGGFENINEAFSISLISSGYAYDFKTKGIVGITDSASINNFQIINNNPLFGPAIGLLQLTGSANNMCSATNGVVKSKATVGLYAITPAGNISISNLDIETDLQTGLYLHNGGTSDTLTGPSMNASHIQVRNTGVANSVSSFGNPATFLVSNAPLIPVGGSSSSALVTNIHSYSKEGAGINVTGFGMKHCYGFSLNHSGISAYDEENQTYRTEIVECVGESMNYHGLDLEKNIYVSGGTFITRSTSALHNPINIKDDATANNNFYIAGVKTIARNTSAFAIDAAFPVTARISGCQFLNEYMTSPVPGVNHVGIGGNITFSAAATDAYGNIS